MIRNQQTISGQIVANIPKLWCLPFSLEKNIGKMFLISALASKSGQIQKIIDFMNRKLNKIKMLFQKGFHSIEALPKTAVANF
jgi:hypothetical protein